MRFTSVAAIALAALLLAGCVPSEPTPTGTASQPTVTPTPTPTPTPTAQGPTPVDPSAYPAYDRAGWGGVMFVMADGQFQCAIFDPNDEVGRTPPLYGCVVSVEGFPYPPLENAARDSANAFLAWGHGPGTATTVTDATFLKQDGAPALLGGTSITWSTVTCEALTDEEVRCTDADSGHGMRVSATDFELF